jgi:hypothetical protein
MSYNTGNYNGSDGTGTYNTFATGATPYITGRANYYMRVPELTSSGLLGVFDQQPNEVLDYDIDFTDWAIVRNDRPNSVTVTAETGLVVLGYTFVGNTVRVVLGGGVTGGAYKVTVRLSTDSVPAVIKEVDFLVRVKEI